MPTGDRVPEPKRAEPTTSSSSPALPTSRPRHAAGGGRLTFGGWPLGASRGLIPGSAKAPSPVRRFPFTPGLSRRPRARAPRDA
nr:unnamed protein product [Digitaria exilis]